MTDRPPQSPSDRRHHRFIATLNAATREVGYTIDDDELDVTVAHHADEVAAWILAAGHYAAAGYLAAVFDAPIDFLHDMAAATPVQDHSPDLALITYLHATRDTHRVARERARAALTSACQTLSTSALLWRREPATAGTGTGTGTGDLTPALIDELAWALTGVGMRAFRPADPHVRAAWRYRDTAADVTVAILADAPATVTITTRRHATEPTVVTCASHTDPAAIIAEAYAALNTRAAPPPPTAHPRWLAGQVYLPTIGGPYPARITTMTTPYTVVVATLTAATVHAVTDDYRKHADQVAIAPTRIRRAGDLTELVDHEGTPDEVISVLTPDAEGFYHLGGTWRLARPIEGVDSTGGTRHG